MTATRGWLCASGSAMWRMDTIHHQKIPCSRHRSSFDLLTLRENIFIFGLTVGEVQALRAQRAYRPRDYYEHDPRVKWVAEALRSTVCCPHEPDLFAWIYRAILDEHDEYMHLADLPTYLEAQHKAGAAFNDRAGWARLAILNVARIGKFSSDRTVEEYARDIWDLRRLAVPGNLEESSRLG
jgi:starch phosphorylase